MKEWRKKKRIGSDFISPHAIDKGIKMDSQTFFDINIHYIDFIFLHNSYHTINEYCLHMIILHIETNT